MPGHRPTRGSRRVPPRVRRSFDSWLTSDVLPELSDGSSGANARARFPRNHVRTLRGCGSIATQVREQNAPDLRDRVRVVLTRVRRLHDQLRLDVLDVGARVSDDAVV